MLEAIKFFGIAGAWILLGVGGLYWIYTALKLSSFLMFLVGVAGPMAIITSPIGAYALIFGWPEWIYSLFG